MSTLPAVADLNGSTVTQGVYRTAIGNLRNVVAELIGGSAEEALTLASDAITPTVSTVQIDTESAAASDNLKTINATNHPSGRLLLIRCANAARVVNVLHNDVATGRIITLDGLTAVLNNTSRFMLLLHNAAAGSWIEVFRSWGPQSAFGLTLMQAADAAAARLLIGGALRTNQADIFAAAGGTANAITLTLSPTPTVIDGFRVVFRATAANTGAVTLNVNGFGVKALRKNSGQELISGNIKIGMIVEATYYAAGDIWQVTSPLHAPLEQGKWSYFIPATALAPNTTLGAGGTTVETTTNKLMLVGATFDKDNEWFVQFPPNVLPKNWDKSSVTARFYWTGPAGTGDCAWDIRGVAAGDGDSYDPSWGSYAGAVADPFQGANLIHVTAETAGFTIGGTPLNDDMIFFQVKRAASAGSDTYNQLATLLGVRIFVNLTAANEA